MCERGVLFLAAMAIGCTAMGDLSAYSSGKGSALGTPSAEDAGGAMQGGSAGIATTSTPADASVPPPLGEGGAPTMIDPPPAGAGGSGAAVPPEEPPPDVPAALPRFVRLVADSDISDTPYTSVAELEIAGATGTLLDRSAWVASADSEELVFVGGAPASKAIDGDPVSIWHTPWFELATPPPHPHHLQIDMGAPTAISAIRYTPRQDMSTDGAIARYRVFVSTDGVDWGEPIAQGTFDASPAVHTIPLPP